MKPKFCLREADLWPQSMTVFPSATRKDELEAHLPGLFKCGRQPTRYGESRPAGTWRPKSGGRSARDCCVESLSHDHGYLSRQEGEGSGPASVLGKNGPSGADAAAWSRSSEPVKLGALVRPASVPHKRARPVLLD